MGQPHKKSKRARKEKDKNSLRQKRRAQGPPDGAPNPLFDETFADGSDGGANALILVPQGVREGGAQISEPAPKVKLTKAQARKAAQVARHKAAKEQRSEVVADLEAAALPAEHQQLLLSTASRGQRATKRQRLRRELMAQRAGIHLPDEGERGPGLEVDRPAPPSDASQSDSDSGGDGGSDSEGGVAQGEPMRSVPLWGAADMDGSAQGQPRTNPTPGAAAAAEAAGKGVPQLSAADQRAAIQAARKELGLSDDAKAEETGTSAPTAPVAGRVPRVVRVERPPAIAEAREGLPIVGMEQEVMEAVAAHDIVLLCGETGCGKTTQVPQFLYEAGYGCAAFPERAGMIGVTQPRRVAAVSTAARVAEEMGGRPGQTVGYQVRYNKAVGAATAVKFMTDGILMREVQDDFLLRRYSVLVVDEAHERSLNTDLLLGLLSRVVPLRRKLAAAGQGPPLKLIIMSATLRLQDFADNRRLFPVAPPVVRVPARQFPVTLHFARRTELHDYVGAALKKVRQIHQRLPPGGILVFVTGQREVEHLCRKLRSSLGPAAAKRAAAAAATAAAAAEGPPSAPRGAAIGAAPTDEADEVAEGDLSGADAAERDAEDGRRVGGNSEVGDYVSEDELMESGDEEEDTQMLGGAGFSAEELATAAAHFEKEMGVSLAAGAAEGAAQPVHVLPLYAVLPAAQQARVFRPPPEGHRLIVVATNVAETSLTIPGVRYVVDTGRSKQRVLEGRAGLAKFEVRWISQAGAAQRAGRAGRTGPGHCYRLYSSAVFNDTFPEHGAPEIETTALDGVVLAMKSLAIDHVPNFPFPSPPPPDALLAAARCLEALGALDVRSARLTELGRAMARLPVSPRHGRMLLQAAAEDAAGGRRKGACLPYAILLAAALSVESPFLHTFHAAPGGGDDGDGGGGSGGADTKAAKQEAGRQRQAARAAHAKLRHSSGDALSSLNALCAYLAAGTASEAFCRANFLQQRSLKEAAALAQQLHRVVLAMGASHQGGEGGGLLAVAAPLLPPQLPTEAPPLKVAVRLRRALAAGWADQVGRRGTSAEKLQALAADGRGGTRAVRYTAAQSADEVYLHPRSALASTAPRFAVYTELLQAEKRAYMSGATAIEAAWLPEVAAPLCQLSPPLEDPPPHYSAAADTVLCWHHVTFGAGSWALPRCQRKHPDAAVRAGCLAAALLSGALLPAWEPLVGSLVAQPASVAHASSRHLPRVAELIDVLVEQKVDSRIRLAAVWAKQPLFLKRQLSGWLRAEARSNLAHLWSELLTQATAAT